VYCSNGEVDESGAYTYTGLEPRNMDDDGTALYEVIAGQKNEDEPQPSIMAVDEAVVSYSNFEGHQGDDGQCYVNLPGDTEATHDNNRQVSRTCTLYRRSGRPMACQ